MSINCLFFQIVDNAHATCAPAGSICLVYRKEGRMPDYLTPIDVVRRNDGSLYVITADELAIIKALGISHQEYAELI